MSLGDLPQSDTVGVYAFARKNEDLPKKTIVTKEEQGALVIWGAWGKCPTPRALAAQRPGNTARVRSGKKGACTVCRLPGIGVLWSWYAALLRRCQGKFFHAIAQSIP